jgi:hypothetical protein
MQLAVLLYTAPDETVMCTEWAKSGGKDRAELETYTVMKRRKFKEMLKRGC